MAIITLYYVEQDIDKGRVAIVITLTITNTSIESQYIPSHLMYIYFIHILTVIGDRMQIMLSCWFNGRAHSFCLGKNRQ
jgi:hypothetical protein